MTVPTPVAKINNSYQSSFANYPSIISSQSANRLFDYNGIRVVYSHFEYHKSQDDTFIEQITKLMNSFNFPNGTQLWVDFKDQTVTFKGEHDSDFSDLYHAYTEICMNRNGIISIPGNASFIHRFSFEVA